MPITISGTTGIAGVDGSAATPSVQGADANTGVFFPAADTVAVTTGGSERMRVDSSGNVGIGVTSGGAKLDVVATGSATAAQFSGGGTYQGFAVKNNQSSASVYGGNYYDARNELNAAVANFLADINTDGSSAWSWSTQAAGTRTDRRVERMRIDSSGNVGIGTSSPLSKLEVNGGAANTYVRIVDTRATYPTYIGAEQGSTVFGRWGLAESMRIDSSGNLLVGIAAANNAATSSAFQYLVGSNLVCSKSLTSNTNQIVFNNPNGQVGTINTSGSTTAYNTSSDYRLKENVQPMVGALDTIALLNPVTYNWKSDGSDGQGFIAHELQAVVPDCVSGEKDAVDADGKPQHQGVDTSFLVATLVAAIQELTARIAALEAK